MEIENGIWSQTQHLMESLESFSKRAAELKKEMNSDGTQAIQLLNHGYELERQVHLKHHELNSYYQASPTF